MKQVRFSTLVLMAALLFSLGTAELHGGPISGEIVNPANGHRYVLLYRSTWVESEMDAALLGGHLATVNNAEEQQFIHNVFGSFGGTGRLLWIGLNDGLSEGNFTWTSGEALTYTNWAPGEPNNAAGEDFVAMYYPGHSSAGKWNDWGTTAFDPIGVPINGVVEIDPDPVSPMFTVATDTSWLVIAPDGNRAGEPITSVGLDYETDHPGWNSDLDFDTSSWIQALMVGDRIWGPGEDTPMYFRKTFSVTDPLDNVSLLGTVDDDVSIWINGNLLVPDSNGVPTYFGPIDVTSHLVPGENLIAAKAHDSYGAYQSVRIALIGTVVPEPSTFLLLGMGALGLLLYRIRKRR